jgi:shikimate dehydrogenase
MGIPYAEVIGDPVDHSKSPLIHEFWLRRLRIEGEYKTVRVTADELPAYFESRRTDHDWRGCNVTMPLKEAALALLDANRATRRIGAVNTVVRYEDRLTGLNTDWQALNLAIDTHRLQPRQAAIIGTGGAARAALEELRGNQVPHVVLVSRNENKAAALLAHFGLRGEVLPPGARPAADLLINASPLGMRGFPPLDIDLSGLWPGAMVVEMVYQPLETALLSDARRRGFRVIDGLTMLIEQASMAFIHFFKVAEPRAGRAELRELLTS